jgi:PTS system galactitol-specific IIC component
MLGVTMAIMDAIQWFLGLGSTVGVPLIIIVLGLIFGLKPSKAIISGLTLGAGFIGLNMVINMMAADLQPAITQMVNRFGLSLSIMDVGCGVGGPLAFASSLGALAIPITIIINLILIWLGMTRILNVDIWNLWQPTLSAC